VTFATQITLFRILLIPVFIGVAIYYGESVSLGQANETLRWTTIAVFATAALSDALDGYVARAFNQKSRLGAILDPLADKLLLLSAIITLSFTGWRQQFPSSFVISLASAEPFSSIISSANATSSRTGPGKSPPSPSSPPCSGSC
jgi:CDP-diacylglycerol--glycerol-3-phosphate 3-phosphatidyltransferase/cardiolipin synthase